LSKFIKLDDRFSVGSDPYNIILKDKEKRFNRGYSYYPNLDLLVSSLVTRLENDAIEVGQSRGDGFLDHSNYIVNSIDRLKQEITVLIEQKLIKLKKDLQ